MHVRYPVGPTEDGLRTDQALARLVPDVSQSRLQKLVRRGQVSLDGKRLTRSNGRVRKGQVFEVWREDVSPPVLYSDDDLLVINKPSGLLTHRLADGKETSLADLLDAEHGPLPITAGIHRPGIVHRLDRETSGVLVVARTELSMAALKESFRSREVEKVYLALCAGSPPAEEWTNETPIGEEGAGDRMRLAGRDAKPALTRFEVARSEGELHWIRAFPVTGRRHQIRVHLLEDGLVVAGDRSYRHPAAKSSVKVPRLALHASSLTLEHPSSGERLTCEAPLPADLKPWWP